MPEQIYWNFEILYGNNAANVTFKFDPKNLIFDRISYEGRQTNNHSDKLFGIN